jgi:hypothetical protein
MIAASSDSVERLALAQRLATRRLARGVVPDLDACFAALGLGTGGSSKKAPDRTNGSAP